MSRRPALLCLLLVVLASTTAVAQSIALRGCRGILPDDHPEMTSWHELADVDGDGDLDLAVGGVGFLAVWLRDDDAVRFEPGSEFQLDPDQKIAGGAFGDFDGDGDLDLVASRRGDSGPGDTERYLNDGSGGFAFDPTFFASQVIASNQRILLVAFDVDGDGDTDIVRGGFQIQLLENDGVGGVQESSLATNSARGLLQGDLDGDGDDDVALERADVYLRNDGGTVFTPVALPPSGNAGMRLRMGDLDGDGDLDFIRGEGVSIVDVLRNDGTGTFFNVGPRGLLPFNFASPAEMLDFDLDGDLDFVVEDKLLRNDGNLNFAFDPSVNPTGSDLGMELVTDLDGDGYPDLITQGARLGVAFNAQGVEFTREEKLEPGFHWIVFDASGDGMPDLFGRDFLLINDGRGRFIDRSIDLPVAPLPVINRFVADFDDDGDRDLATPSQQAGLSLALNDGAGVFTTMAVPPTVITMLGSEIPLVDDFDGDGDQDFVKLGSPALYLENIGGLNFVQWPFPAPVGQRAAADMNGDGDLNVVVAPWSWISGRWI